MSMKFLVGSIIFLLTVNGCSCYMNKINSTPRQIVDGLSYVIMRRAANSALEVQPGQRITVHYTGWLADNNGELMKDKRFDSSIERGVPFTFVVGAGHVIQGWDKGVVGMKIGEKRRLIIAPALGYGVRGVPGVIPGNATLIFDVELIAIN